MPRRILSFAFGLIILAVLFLAGTGIILEFYLPKEQVRKLAEDSLSHVLNIPVAIGAVDLSFIRGIRIKKISIGANGFLLKMNSATLDYDLIQLLEGRFTVNEVSAQQP